MIYYLVIMTWRTSTLYHRLHTNKYSQRGRHNHIFIFSVCFLMMADTLCLHSLLLRPPVETKQEKVIGQSWNSLSHCKAPSGFYKTATTCHLLQVWKCQGVLKPTLEQQVGQSTTASLSHTHRKIISKQQKHFNVFSDCYAAIKWPIYLGNIKAAVCKNCPASNC